LACDEPRDGLAHLLGDREKVHRIPQAVRPHDVGPRVVQRPRTFGRRMPVVRTRVVLEGHGHHRWKARFRNALDREQRLP
jgi:hypothetical protein